MTTALSHAHVTHTHPHTLPMKAPASSCCCFSEGGAGAGGAHGSGLGLRVPRRGLYNTTSPNCAPKPASLPRGQRLHAGDLTPSLLLQPETSPARLRPAPPASRAHGTGSVWDSSFSARTKGPSSQGLEPRRPRRGGVPVAGIMALTLPGPRERLARVGDGCGRARLRGRLLMPCLRACSPSPPWWEGEWG